MTSASAAISRGPSGQRDCTESMPTSLAAPAPVDVLVRQRFQ